MATKRRKETQRKDCDEVFVHLMPLGGYPSVKEQVTAGVSRRCQSYYFIILINRGSEV